MKEEVILLDHTFAYDLNLNHMYMYTLHTPHRIHTTKHMHYIYTHTFRPFHLVRINTDTIIPPALLSLPIPVVMYNRERVGEAYTYTH